MAGARRGTGKGSYHSLFIPIFALQDQDHTLALLLSFNYVPEAFLEQYKSNRNSLLSTVQCLNQFSGSRVCQRMVTFSMAMTVAHLWGMELDHVGQNHRTERWVASRMRLVCFYQSVVTTLHCTIDTQTCPDTGVFILPGLILFQ